MGEKHRRSPAHPILKGMALLILFLAGASSEVLAAPQTSEDHTASSAESAGASVLWVEGYVTARGQAVAPAGREKTPQGQLLARRGAVVDLQRTLLEFVQGIRVDGISTMRDYVVHDEVRTALAGTIRGVQILEGRWDGNVYTVEGRVPLEGVRRALAPGIALLRDRPTPPFRGNGYSRLVVDARHLPLVPSLGGALIDDHGEEVHGVRFADRRAFVDRGLWRYETSEDRPSALRPAPPGAWPFTAAPALAAEEDRPLTLRATGLAGPSGTDLVLSREDAELIRHNAYDFRLPCQITVIIRSSAIRGYGGPGTARALADSALGAP